MRVLEAACFVSRDAVHSTALDQFVPDDFGLLYVALGGLLLDEVGEEEGSQHGEHDEELECDDEPELLTRRCEATEAISVEAIGTHERIWSRCLSRHEVDEVR